MQNNIVLGLHYLRMAKECFADLQREKKDSLLETMGKRYESKIDWIYNDFISCRHFTPEIREGCRREWGSDVFAVPAIQEKIVLLDPDFRELIESVIDAKLNGEEILIQDIK